MTPERATHGAAAPVRLGQATPPGIELTRGGLSQDLLCALATSTRAKPPAKLEKTPLACACAAATPACRVIGSRGDRRRSLLLAPGTEAKTSLSVPAGASLRFAALALGPLPTAFEVQIDVRDPATGEERRWERRVRLLDRWVDADLDLGAFAGRTVEMRASVAPLLSPSPAPWATLALAAPRLVVPTTPKDGPTNVVVYLIDTLRPDHTSAYGYPRDTTPRLADLARRGILFENAYSVASWTRPAVASLFTGLYPGHHGVHTQSGLPSSLPTIAERFREAGWSTWAFVTNGHVLDDKLNFEQGFDRFVALRGRNLDNHARSEEINEALLPHLSARHDEPFLLYVHAVDPHSPYDPPASHRGRFTDASYAGSVEPRETLEHQLRARKMGPADLAHVIGLYDEDTLYQDDMLGVLLDHLAATGLSGRTIVLVVADHGEELHDHGDWAHGERLWEEVTRIPLVVSVPGVADLAGRRIAERVQIVDVMPTLLRWFGVRGADDCDGRDLTSLLIAADAEPSAERAVYLEENRPSEGYDLVGLIHGGWKIIRRRPSAGAISEGADVPDRLFDLDADPRERVDRAATAPRRLARMQRRLARAESRLGARRSALAPSEPVLLAPETRRQLEALGYVDGPGPLPSPAAP